MSAEPERIVPRMSRKEILDFLRSIPSHSYLMTNNERDVSQSDFKCRIMPQTTLKVAPQRDQAGFFAFEISGGASVHMDLMRKQINPFDKLRLVRKAMPHTLLQTVCRGRNLFGYRHHPDNVIRYTVRAFSKYIDVWRIYDFLNHIPNLKVAAEEVLAVGKVLMPCICFSTGRGHKIDFYLGKVEEILSLLGEEIILCIKNHSALGSAESIGDLVKAIRTRFPDLLVAYHGHNTDGNDLSRMVAAVLNGAKIVEAADHGFGAIYSQASALSLAQTLHNYGYTAQGLQVRPLVEVSDTLRRERRYYERFESPYRGFDPTVERHKLTGGAASLSFEQAEQVGLLERIDEVFWELRQVTLELGNIWSVTPGSQILWATAVNNVLHGRYEKPSDDLKRLLLGGYGPFPFYEPEEWIYKKVLEYQRTDGKSWKEILREEGGIRELPDENLKEKERYLEAELNRPVSREELCLYLLFPKDALDYFRFEERFGKTWLLPLDVWFKKNGAFRDGEQITVSDCDGKTHHIEVVSTRREGNHVYTSLLVDYHFQTYTTVMEQKTEC